MGDGEFVVAQTSDVAGYSSTDYHDPCELTSADVPDTLTNAEGKLDSSAPPNEAILVAHGSNLDAASGYGSSVNGVNGAEDVANVNIMENGVTSTAGTGSALLHQPLGGSGLSTEEERLWSIVMTNSLDFNAWTSLIEETERTSETF